MSSPVYKYTAYSKQNFRKYRSS